MAQNTTHTDSVAKQESSSNTDLVRAIDDENTDSETEKTESLSEVKVEQPAGATIKTEFNAEEFHFKLFHGALCPGQIGASTDEDAEDADKRFLCAVCGHMTRQAGNLWTHMLTHSDERPHKCTECDFATKGAGNLRRHVMVAHTGERPHQCALCDYATAHPNCLKLHMASKHSAARPFPCPLQCGAAFPFQGRLNQHILTHHTDIRPFPCHQCQRAFRTRRDLRRHMYTHNGDKPIKCALCDFTAVQSWHLKRHMSTHQPKAAHIPHARTPYGDIRAIPHE